MEVTGKAGEEQENQTETTPLSCAPPLPSQKLLTHEGGGTGIGGDGQVG